MKPSYRTEGGRFLIGDATNSIEWGPIPASKKVLQNRVSDAARAIKVLRDVSWATWFFKTLLRSGRLKVLNGILNILETEDMTLKIKRGSKG